MTYSTYRIFTFINLLLMTLLFFASSAYSANSNVNSHTSGKSWLSASDNSYQNDKSFFVSLEFELKDGWHIYWQNPGDSGLPVEIKWVLPDGFDASPIHWEIPKREVLLGITSFTYANNTKLFIPITPNKNASFPDKIVLEAKSEWLACKDICIPESASYYLTLDNNKSGNIVSDIDLSNLAKTIKNNAKYNISDDIVTVQIATNSHPEILSHIKSESIINADLFAIDTGIIDHHPPINSNISNDYITMSFNKSDYSIEIEEWKGLFLITDKSGKRYGFNTRLEKGNIATILPADKCITGDEGYDEKSCGLVDDLTSVQSEKISFALALLFAFIGGVILNAMPCVLPVLSLKIMDLVNKSHLSRGLVVRHGISYTVGILVCFLSIAGLLIILQQGGEAIGWGFQLQSPSFVSFLVVLFLMIGLNLSGLFEIPSIMGNIGGNIANKDNPTGSFFTGALAALVATPCTVPFMAPAIGFALTRSPIESLAVFAMLGLGMAVPFLLLSLSPALSRLIPKPGAWMYKLKLWLALPMYATSIWLLWVLLAQTNIEIIGYIISGLLLIIILLVFYKKLLNYGKIRQVIMAAIMLLITGIIYFTYIQSSEIIASGKHTERGVPFSLDKIKELRSQGKAVFVDATAEWCLTCKINEMTTINSNKVMNHFKDNDITLMIADWTNQDETISKYLSSFNRQGVPVYVFYPADGSQPKLLPQLLTPSLVIEETQ